MTCFRCLTTVAASRYGHTGTLCEACLADEVERTELERLDQQEGTERMRRENDEWIGRRVEQR
jgi:ferritin-like protein